jgi:hypothetical protein
MILKIIKIQIILFLQFKLFNLRLQNKLEFYSYNNYFIENLGPRLWIDFKILRLYLFSNMSSKNFFFKKIY